MTLEQDMADVNAELDAADPKVLTLAGASAAMAAALGFTEAAREGCPTIDPLVIEELAQALVVAGALTDDLRRDGQLIGAAEKWLGENT
jgi:hypothetical protein